MKEKNFYSNEIIVKIDKTNPTCKIILSGVNGENELGKSSTCYKTVNKDDVTNFMVNINILLEGTSTIYTSGTVASTNSNSKTINIDKISPTISSLTGTSLTVNNYNTTSLKLTAVANDTGSGILRYEFYKISQSYDEETLMVSNTTGTCYSGTRTNIYTCTTGRQYSVTTSSGCITTTTTNSSNCNPSCSSGYYQCGCTC